jgi:hypothetical protein
MPPAAVVPTLPQPCLKNVDDLLFGRTRILPSDDLVIGYQGSRGLLLTQDSGILNVDLQTLNDGSAGFTQPAVVGARMFNTASDVAVTLVGFRNNNTLQWRLDSSSGTVASGVVRLPVSVPDPRSFLSVIAGDFTGEGLDEIVVFLTAVGANGSAIAATALDPE